MLLLKTKYKGMLVTIRHIPKWYWVNFHFPNGGISAVHFRSRAQAFKFVSFLGCKVEQQQQQNLFSN